MVTHKLIKPVFELTELLLTRIYKTVAGFNDKLTSVTAEDLYVKNQVKQNSFSRNVA